MDKVIKKYPTLGVCGLDCGLCPRYYIKGPSRCPGCCGPDFSDKHPSCSLVTCCVKKQNFEVCAECNKFPCSKLKGWDKGDSFVTHRKSISNLNSIKKQGLEKFIKQQKRRIELLEIFLKHFDEGRSKNFYCIATTILSVYELETSLRIGKQKIKTEKVREDDLKAKSLLLKEQLEKSASRKRVELKLRK
ncbi:MAG: DUF3795 domain-containing protein [Patescibacteria group bacterium]|nr:DUF3795 domain-containing protein [Patescibacteria group bacterium]